MILLGPPGTGKTHLAVALSIRACLAGQRVQFATATQWVARLSEAKRQGSLETELRRLSFIPLLVVDEVGYIPFDPEAANLMFSLVSSRYERASMIVTSQQALQRVGRDLRRRSARRPAAGGTSAASGRPRSGARQAGGGPRGALGPVGRRWWRLRGRSGRRSPGGRTARRAGVHAMSRRATPRGASRQACQPAASRAALPISSKRLIRVRTHPSSDSASSSRSVSSSSQRSSMTDWRLELDHRAVRSPRPRPRGRRSAARRRSRASPTMSKGNQARSPSGVVMASQTLRPGGRARGGSAARSGRRP